MKLQFLVLGLSSFVELISVVYLTNSNICEWNSPVLLRCNLGAFNIGNPKKNPESLMNSYEICKSLGNAKDPRNAAFAVFSFFLFLSC